MATYLAIVETYRDEDCDNEIPLPERPDGGRLLRDAAAGRFEVVLIARSCRWSRLPEVYHLGRRELIRLGVDLQSISETLAWDTPSRAFSSDMQLRSNEMFRDVINDQLTKGRYRRASEPGGYPGGICPYGFRVVVDAQGSRERRRLEVDPDEADVIRRIFDLIVSEGLSSVRIAALLNEEGVPTAINSGAHRPQWNGRGSRGLWHPSTVRKIIRNPLYRTGERAWGGTYSEGVTNRLAAIVGEDAWDRAQDLLSGHCSRSKRQQKRDFLLRGLVVCGHCGRRFVGWTVTKRKGARPTVYYRSPRPDPVLGRCPVKTLLAAPLEEDLWETVAAHVEDLDCTLAAIRGRWEEEQGHMADLVRRRDDLLKRRAGLLREEEGAVRGVDWLGVELTADQCRALLSRVSADLAKNCAAREALAAQLAAASSRAARLKAAASNLRGWQARQRAPQTDEDRALLVRTLVDQVSVEVQEGRPVVTYHMCFEAGGAMGPATLGRPRSCR